MQETHESAALLTELSAHPERLRCVTNDQLLLILLPTEACNFRCTYCYESFRLTRMQPWVVEALKRFITIRAPELRVLELNWFGGEPLLALDVVEDISRHVQRVERHHHRIRSKCGITTNAYLLGRTRFDELLDLGVRDFQIALDGPREHHDRKRVLAGGRPTFDRVWGNVLATRQVNRPFKITLRLHVDPENCVALEEFLCEIAACFGTDSRYELFIRTVKRLGGPHDAQLPVFDETEGKRAVRKLSQRAMQLGIPHTTLEQRTPVCYAARGNAYVVRADGRLNKCSVALDHPENQVGRLLKDGRIQVDAQRMEHWMRGVWSGNPAELECPMRGYAGV